VDPFSLKAATCPPGFRQRRRLGEQQRRREHLSAARPARRNTGAPKPKAPRARAGAAAKLRSSSFHAAGQKKLPAVCAATASRHALGNALSESDENTPQAPTASRTKSSPPPRRSPRRSPPPLQTLRCSPPFCRRRNRKRKHHLQHHSKPSPRDHAPALTCTATSGVQQFRRAAPVTTWTKSRLWLKQVEQRRQSTSWCRWT
jgi:hypothetical protein